MNSACRLPPKKQRRLPCSPTRPGSSGRQMCPRPPAPGGRQFSEKFLMPRAKTCVALLRGINVGGNRRVAMADLRAWLEELGLKHVRTYLQSGNAVFQSDQPRVSLAPAIEKKIEKEAGFPVRVVVRTAQELKRVVEINPFLKRAGVDAAKLHVTFLAEKPEA